MLFIALWRRFVMNYLSSRAFPNFRSMMLASMRSNIYFRFGTMHMYTIAPENDTSIGSM